MNASPGRVASAHRSALHNAGQPASNVGVTRSRFYAVMSSLCLAVAVIGFLPTFFVPLVLGEFSRPPVFYIHVALFFGWTAYFCAQSWMAACGRIQAHREWGVLGAALATGMIFSVISVVAVRLNQTPPMPRGAPGSPEFTWTDVWVCAYFAACIVLALSATRRPETHKRFMLLATLSLLLAPIARSGVFFPPAANGGPPIAAILFANSFLLALMAAPMVHDWRTQQRVSRIYLVGVPIYFVLSLTSAPVGALPPALVIADWIKHLPG